MVSVTTCDRDVLRFLWVTDVRQPEPEIVVLRFTRVVFGMDDVAASVANVDEGYNFYLRAKLHLSRASFNLRRFESNSLDLRQRIRENEQVSHSCGSSDKPQNLSGGQDRQPTVQQVLGVCWDVTNDELVLTLLMSRVL